jgi:flagellar biosynthetic protein FliO
MTQSPDIFEAAMRMFSSLGLVLAIIIGFSYGLRHFAQRGFEGKKNQLIQVMETRSLGGKKSIAIVKVAEAVLIVGITGERLTLLTRLEKDESSHLLSFNSGMEKGPSFFSSVLKMSLKSHKSGDIHE